MASSRLHTARLPFFSPLPPRGSEEAGGSGKRKRSSRPKVRSGCLTCKRRHVKCDERKPFCLRCEKADIECAGYSSPKPPEPKKPAKEVVSRTVRPLLPRSESPSGGGSSQAASSDSFVPSFLAVPASSMFAGVASNYFDLFHPHLSHEQLVGLSPIDFWTNAVVPESQGDECIYNSMLAINLLSDALCLGVEAPTPTATHAAGLHHSSPPAEPLKAALQRHMTAVSMFRTRIAQDGNISPRTVLIATVLFVAYELLQGNIETADSLAVKGVTLLRDRLWIGHSASPSPAPSSLSSFGTLDTSDFGSLDGSDLVFSDIDAGLDNIDPLLI